MYSGIAIYSIPGLDIPIRVNKYVDGKKIGGIFLPADKDGIKKNVLVARQLLGNIAIARKSSSAMTRSWGEDDDNWFDDWLNDIYNSIPDGSDASVEYEYDEELGGWWAHIYDGNGNHINDSYLPNPDPTPDPAPEPEPDPGAGIDGNECPACGNDPCTCNDGNEGNEGDKKPDISPLTQKIFNFTNSNLTTEQIEKLNSIIDKITQNKVAKFLCESLTSQVKIQYKSDLPSNVNGKYNAIDKTVYIKNFDGKGINRTMVEELTHALQDQFYPGGIKNYGSSNSGPNPPGFCNVEFEAHMIKGLYDFMNGDKIIGYGFENTNASIQLDLEMIMRTGIIDGVFSGQTLHDAYLNDFMNAQSDYKSASSENIDMRLFNYIISLITKN